MQSNVSCVLFALRLLVRAEGRTLMQSAGAVESVASVAAAMPETLWMTVGGMPASGLVESSLSSGSD